MSVKRRDKRNRILRNGESQRPDGRYAYVYVDGNGKQKFLYSWKLESTDRVPQGKRECISLREKIRRLKRDLDDGIEVGGGGMTVLQLVHKYVSLKAGVRHNTRANYNFVVNLIEKENFGAKQICKVKLSDAKAFLIKLQADGRGYSTIHVVRGVLRPAFQMAVDDDLIRKNPFEFPISAVVVNDSVAREALTECQEREFLEFVRNDNYFCRYYDAIYILFHTGLRISEFAGLTLSDIDFESRKIRVDHQLQRTRDMRYVVENTKTSCGVREIPMEDGVYDCFARIVASRPKPRKEPAVGGKKGFLYLDKNGMPMVALHWEKYFQHIREKHDRVCLGEMPKVTPHVCRHTFCSNMAKAGMNPKTLQYLMGHSDIGVTLNVYTHVGYEDARKELARVKKCGGSGTVY